MSENLPTFSQLDEQYKPDEGKVTPSFLVEDENDKIRVAQIVDMNERNQDHKGALRAVYTDDKRNRREKWVDENTLSDDAQVELANELAFSVKRTPEQLERGTEVQRELGGSAIAQQTAPADSFPSGLNMPSNKLVYENHQPINGLNMDQPSIDEPIPQTPEKEPSVASEAFASVQKSVEQLKRNLEGRGFERFLAEATTNVEQKMNQGVSSKNIDEITRILTTLNQDLYQVYVDLTIIARTINTVEIANPDEHAEIAPKLEALSRETVSIRGDIDKVGVTPLGELLAKANNLVYQYNDYDAETFKVALANYMMHLEHDVPVVIEKVKNLSRN